jgi:tRNA pseudouridine38-40 synthase
VRDAVNAHLVPQPVTVLEAAVAEDDFHARFSASDGAICSASSTGARRRPWSAGRVWHVRKPLDEAAMAEGARELVGRHDFTTFATPPARRRVPSAPWISLVVSRVGEEIRLEFAARSFLHRQVRSITGTLAEAGAGRWSPEDVRAALEARSRAACGPVAPPEGLYLTGVSY